jgi:nucleolar protein 14
MRELRRDSDFIDQERYKEQSEANNKRREERVKNWGWMEEQQATINQQVRKGGGLMKGGGTSVFKKARVKR